MIYFRYLRSVAYKVIGNFEKSQKDYRDILRSIEIEEGSNFAKYIFAMILMPVETNRRNLLKYVDDYKNILDMFEEDRDRKVLCKHYLKYIDKNQVYIGDNVNAKWLDKRIPEIIKILQEKSFFKRFGLLRLVEILN